VVVPTRTVRGISIVVGFLVLLMGLYVIGKRVPSYRAEARVAITPTAGEDSAAAVDGLTAGDVVATYAQAFGGTEVIRPALADDAKLDELEAKTVSIETGIVPDTAVITVEATAPSREMAEAAATAVASRRPQIKGLRSLYEPHLVRSAAGSAERTGTSPMMSRVQVLIIAIVFALITASLVRRIPAEPEPPPATAGGASGGAA
jgi:capsular polysaccharide biosynthesis protein